MVTNIELTKRNHKLSCQLYQRSADMFLGVPFNIASYSLLTHIIAKEIGFEVGEFVHTFGDLHIYKDHLDVVEEQIKRVPQTLPTLEINTVKKLKEYTIDDFVLKDYSPMPSLKAKMAV
jgi:thymidylate synthase